MELAGTVYLSKAKFLVLSLLSVQLGVLTSNSINESDVAEYLIQRRKNVGDIFSVVFKPECSKLSCNPTGSAVYGWCGNYSAKFISSSGGRYTCSCYGFRTFLPKLGNCVNKSTAVKHFEGSSTGECTTYFKAWPWLNLFMKTFDLGVIGSQSGPDQYHNCDVVPGSTMYYIYGLKPRWENASKKIFSFTDSNGPNLVWKADKELSGRIIRLKVSCRGEAQSVTGCLLVKAFGNVTYCRLDSGFVQRSVCPTSTNTSTIMPSLLPSSSPSSSSSFMLETTRTGQLTPVSSSYSLSQTDSISSAALIPSPSHILQTSSSEMSSSMPVNPQESSNQVVRSSIYAPPVPPLEPSKSLTVTATSSPANKGPGGAGGADAQKGEGDNGAVIGAAVGGAVFFTIVVIAVVVFCKRRKQKPTKDKKLQREVKNPVYGTADNDINMTPKRQSQAMTSRDQDQPPVYQSPSKNNGHSTEQEVYENPESNYDNQPVYQSLDNKTAAAGQQPVYQSLQSGTTEPEYTYAKAEPSHGGKQMKPARPELGATDEQRKRFSVNSGPVNKEPNPGESKTADESLYNVLEGPDSDQDYEPVEGQGDAQEPLYNVLDGEVPDGSHSEPEPLYNVLDGPDPGEYEDAAYAAPGGPIPGGPVPPRALENPAYEVTQEFGAPEASQYAAVERPGPQRESAYEPLRRPNREDTYESLG